MVALYGVHYDEANSVRPITGIGELINGLSGKFLSSVVALAASVLTVGERFLIRRARRAYDRLLMLASTAIPYLSQSRILLDIQRFAAKQTVRQPHQCRSSRPIRFRVPNRSHARISQSQVSEGRQPSHATPYARLPPSCGGRAAHRR